MSPEPTLLAIRLAPARHFAAVTLPVLGVAVRFESNSPEVVRVAEESFGWWRVLERDPSLSVGGGRACIRIRVRPGGRGVGMGCEVDHGVPRRDLLIVSGPAVRGYADALRREAVAEVDEALVAEGHHFRTLVLEAMALFLVTRQDREPLHAAAVVRGGSALVLAAPSGVGKSTTVYAARRAGLRVLAEDAVFLQLRPFRVWGMPGAMNLHPASVRFFPELAGVPPTRMVNGKHKLALALRGTDGAAEWPLAGRVGVCLVARGGDADIERVGAEEMTRRLTSGLEPGFSHFTGTIRPRVRRLVERGGWRMTLPPHPADAVPLLHRMLDEIDA